MEYLIGHVSPETAYLVSDYPYGFRLRCKIRYWLEWKEGVGFRFCSQTTNPKRSGEFWNKPKKATYNHGPLVLALVDNGHVVTSGMHYGSSSSAGLREWKEKAGAFLLPEAMPELDKFIWVKARYEELQAQGHDYAAAGKTACLEFIHQEFRRETNR